MVPRGETAPHSAEPWAALREQTGDFGELVYAGMDWVDPKLEKRSMQLMAEEVMPRVNAAIAKPSGLRQRTGSAQ